MMVRQYSPIQYPLDNSAIIHLASMKKNHSNSFRITAILTEPVIPKKLQEALNHVTPRFPMLVAGIQRGIFQYKVVPVRKPPLIQPEEEILAPMSKKEIRSCAMRVLYQGCRVSVEFFHSLTDGYGGSVFLSTLLAEYCSIRYASHCQYTEQVLDPCGAVHEGEITDDYLTYAKPCAGQVNHRKVYQLPSPALEDTSIHTATGIYDTQALLDAAHRWGVSLTVFLTAVMFAAVMEIQSRDCSSGNSDEPIQLMVPINLRRRFESKTLRNFSLYALPCIEPSSEKMSFASLVRQVNKQMKKETSREHLAGMMGTNVFVQKLPIYRIFPLWLKDALLHIIYHFFGGRNSCLSISNLGELVYPEGLKQYVKQVEVFLTPRRYSSCNCGVISYNGMLVISFTGMSAEMELERRFFMRLNEYASCLDYLHT